MSLAKVKKLVEEIIGIVAVTRDMCPNQCHAYLGPLALLENCMQCNKPCYDSEELTLTGKKVSLMEFDTYLLGPQLQVSQRSPKTTFAMCYLATKVQSVKEALEVLEDKTGADFIYNDYACEEAFLDFVEKHKLTEDDHILMISTNSFQLYKNKKSDTYIGIWVLKDLRQDQRVWKVNLMPAFNVPSPNKVKNLDLFLLLSLQHVSALQKKNGGHGYKEWDAAKQEVVYSRLGVVYKTANHISLVEMDGHVGHYGAIGCHSNCPMWGRHKLNSGHYFLAHYHTINAIPGCMHPDFDFNNIQAPSQEHYLECLNTVIMSMTQTQYVAN
uniref:Uncharacterized protein n=2 Tax=Moniliophthora roreri TaxID=221103 RepID=A0A0W0F5I9_MONRR